MKALLWSCLLGSLALHVAAQDTVAPRSPRMAQLRPATFDYDLQPRQIARNTWVIEGAEQDFARSNGCNIINTAFIATGQGVIVVNTGPSRRYGEQQRAAIARTTSEPVVRVLNLNLHPDYFFGNQAWQDVPTMALAATIEGQRQEGEAYSDNLYRLCGDWMQGTQATPASSVQPVPATLQLGSHTLQFHRLHGHTPDDLVLIDTSTGVLFAGGLVFYNRAPTTPHAHARDWLHSLSQLEQWHTQKRFQHVVPSHGPVHTGLAGIAQMQDWLQWSTQWMAHNAEHGMDLSEVLHAPLPARFATWSAQPTEWHRTLAHWYPAFERRALPSPSPSP